MARMIERKCESCEGLFLCRASEVKRGGGKFCNRACVGKWLTNVRRGPMHHAWKGGESVSAKKYREQNPEKFYAKNSVHGAVYRGTLKKPDKCERCGKVTAKEKLDGHHEDYSKRLEVVWVCRKCHKAIHRAKNSENASHVEVDAIQQHN